MGWLGLSNGLPYLRHIQPALQKLTTLFPGLKLKVICDEPLQLDGVTVDNAPWRQETEQDHLRSFDIGIMPLWDSLWTRGKCAYKIVQYMGVGLPVVASPVGMNLQVVSSGENGFLADTQEDWVTYLSRLIEDAQLREQFGLRGRERVEQNYSLDRFAHGYVDLLRQVTGGDARKEGQIPGNAD
jgi:glycosyltransferase involved in cell wall biosynthesis